MNNWKTLSIILGVLIVGVGVFFYANFKGIFMLKMEQKEKEKLTITLVDDSFEYIKLRKLQRVTPIIEKTLTLQGFNFDSRKGTDGFLLNTTIYSAPESKKWADKLQQLLGTGLVNTDEKLLKENIKIELGIDSIASLSKPASFNNQNILLNATGKEEFSERVSKLLNDKGLNIAHIYNIGTQPQTLITAPKDLKERAELTKRTLENGAIKTNEGLAEVVITLGEDYSQNISSKKVKNQIAKADTAINPNRAVTAIEDVVKNPDYPYWAVIDKSDFELRLYDLENQLLKIYPMAYGMDEDGGDKRSVRDNRTPEGDFFICQIQNSSYWKFEGEDGAYGPFFLRLKTPPWEGIGIHGTNHPESIGTKATHGCIRLHSVDLLAFKKYADLGMSVRIQP